MYKFLSSIFFVMSVIIGSSQFTSAQTLTKTELVNLMVELTVAGHPRLTEDKIAAETVDMNKYQEEERRDYPQFIEYALKDNAKLTADQKAFAKANSDKLVELMIQKVADYQKKSNNAETWLKEALTKNYTLKLTTAELDKLLKYFLTDEGKTVLIYTATAPLNKLNGGQAVSTKAEKLAHGKFVKTLLGKKFMAIFIKDSDVYLNAKSQVASKTYLKEIQTLYDSAGLNPLINQFVTENYKK